MYEIFYGLNARPFQMTPNLDYFCLTQVHKRALAHLRYGLQQAEGFIIFTGAAGTGKTILSQVLFRDMAKINIHAASISRAMMESDILSSLLSAFGKPEVDAQTRTLMSQCEAFLLSRAQRGLRCVVVIDEAQYLSQKSLEILRLLSNMQFQDRAILQIVLVGDITLDDHIFIQQNHLLRQRVVLSYQLNTFQIEDTTLYIKHRLKVAGAGSELGFNKEVLEIIQSLSQGVASEINRLCDRLLMQSMLRGKHHITAQDVRQLLTDDSKYGISEALPYESANEFEKPIIDTVLETVEDEMTVKQEPAFSEESREEPQKDSPKDIQEKLSQEKQSKDENLSEGFMGELEKELEKELSSNTPSASASFAKPKKSTGVGVISILALSYAASLALALIFFYSDKLPLIADAVAGLVEDSHVESNEQPVKQAPTQTVKRGASSLAVID